MAEEQQALENEDQGAEIEVEESGGGVEVSSQSESQEVSTASAETDSEQGDDDLESYSKNVQKRIKKLTEKYRQAERDQEEAVRLAQQLKAENDQIKGRLENLDKGYLNEYGTRLENQLNVAKQAYRDAHDRGDVDKMFEAQQMLNRVSIEQERYRLAKQRQDQNAQRVQVQQQPEQQATYQQQPQQQAPKPDPRAESWAEKNDWFGQDEVMTYAAFGIHRKLVEEEGFDPSSDDYYNEIDRRMRKEFPNRFGAAKTGSVQVASADTSASRSRNSGRRKVKLSPSQVAMAKKLGVPLEEYAKYVKD